jgi:hypothetical protein
LASSAAQADVSKENKVLNSLHPNQLPSSIAGTSNTCQPEKLFKLKSSTLNNKNGECKAGTSGQSKILKIKHSKVIQNFSKKDSVVTTTKKKKILCETTAVTTSATTTSVKIAKEHHQVPRKKIKVSAQEPKPVKPASPTSESVDQTFFDLDFVGTSNDLYGDDSIPCCSKSFIYHQQKSPSSLSNSSCSNSSQSNLNVQPSTQLKMTNFLPVKKHQKLRKTKFGKECGKSCTKIGLKKQLKSKLKTSKTDLANDEFLLHDSLVETTTSQSSNVVTPPVVGATKILKKKKRILKTENTSLKRKKSRSKPLLH